LISRLFENADAIFWSRFNPSKAGLLV